LRIFIIYVIPIFVGYYIGLLLYKKNQSIWHSYIYVVVVGLLWHFFIKAPVVSSILYGSIAYGIGVYFVKNDIVQL